MWEEQEVLSSTRRMQFDERLISTRWGLSLLAWLRGVDGDSFRRNLDGQEAIDSFTWIITYHHMKDFLDVERMLETRSLVLFISPNPTFALF